MNKHALPWSPTWLSPLIGLFFAATASGDFLSFVPVTQTVLLGQQAVVQVEISDTAAFAAPSIGGYDLTVAFDSGILAASEVIFQSFLGNPLSLTAADISIPGFVNLAEVSFLSPAELDALQPDTFLLGLLVFDTIALGVSPLSFASLLVSDAFGIPGLVQGGTAS